MSIVDDNALRCTLFSTLQSIQLYLVLDDSSIWAEQRLKLKLFICICSAEITDSSAQYALYVSTHRFRNRQLIWLICSCFSLYRSIIFICARQQTAAATTATTLTRFFVFVCCLVWLTENHCFQFINFYSFSLFPHILSLNRAQGQSSCVRE